MSERSLKHRPTSVSRWDREGKDCWANLNSLNMAARRTDQSTRRQTRVGSIVRRRNRQAQLFTKVPDATRSAVWDCQLVAVKIAAIMALSQQSHRFM